MNLTSNVRKWYNEQVFSTWSESTGLLADEEAIFRRHPLPASPDTRILELGSGGGRMLLGLHERGYRRLLGVDISERLVAAANARAGQTGGAVRFERQDVCALPYPDASFDVVLGLAQILCHLEDDADRRRGLAHIHRVLVPGGLFYLSVLSWEGRRSNPLIAAAAAPFKVLKGEWHALSRYYLPLLQVGDGLNVRFAWERQPYMLFFTRERFEREVTAAGFEILHLASSRMLAEGREEYVPGGYLFAVARKIGAPAPAAASGATPG